jgi:hypothetical protein
LLLTIADFALAVKGEFEALDFHRTAEHSTAEYIVIKKVEVVEP